jgi:hypothetical protein
MKFAYEDLSDKQFEELVILICQKLLGIGVQGFSEGADGGRDAKFVGAAEIYPSKVAPWVGTIIVQAKHTNGYNRSFSETDFYSPDSNTTVLAEEIPRIKSLRKNKELNHYMLFANRRLSGNAECEIRNFIAKECGIPLASICLCGLEQLELWLKTFPDIPKIANIDPLDSPLIVSPDDLSQIVQALAQALVVSKSIKDDPPIPRITYAVKNRINNMSVDYANDLRNRYLSDTAQIKKFLADPNNSAILELYQAVTEEFQLKIIAKRKSYQSFDEVMNYLADLLFSRDAVLRQRSHKRLTRAMLFYMYWNCDIGQETNAQTN